MTSKELAEEIRSIITYLCEVSGKQDKYALECCDELDKKLEVLDMLRPYFNELQGGYLIDEMFLDDKDACEEAKEEYKKIKGWLENDK